MTQEEINKAFTKAVMVGNTQDVINALEQGADLFIKDSKGNSVLSTAAYKRNFETFEFLLKVQKDNKKIDLDELNINGETVLLSLIKAGADNKFLKMIIDAGANPNIAGENVLPPLMHALAHENMDLVEMLIASGADVNVKMKKTGATPLLMLATTTTSKYQDSICQLLLDNGADVNAQDINGRTPLMNLELRTKEFMKKPELEAADKTREIIFNHPNFNAKVLDVFGGDTLFFYVMKNGYDEFAEKLIAKGGDINVWQNLFQGNSVNTSTAHLIMERMVMEAQNLVLEDPTANSNSTANNTVITNSPASIASNVPNVQKEKTLNSYFEDTMKLMTNNNVDLTKPDSNGNSAVSFVWMGSPDLVSLWMDKKLPIVSEYFRFDRKSGFKTSVDILSRWIAEPSGNDAVDYLINNGVRLTHETATNAVITNNEPLHVTITHLNLNAMSQLLANGVNPNSQLKKSEDGEYITPMRVFASGILAGNYQKAITDLKQLKRLKAGYEENELNGVENTLMPVETYEKTCESVEKLEKVVEQVEMYRMQALDELISAGADINLLDKNNRTPIFYVSDYKTLKLMESLGADLFAKNEKDENFLEYLFKYKNDSKIILDVLEKYSDAGDNLGTRPFYELSFLDVSNSSDQTENVIVNMKHLLTDEQKEHYQKNLSIESLKNSLKNSEERLARQNDGSAYGRNEALVEKLEKDIVDLNAKLVEYGEIQNFEAAGVNYQDEDGNSPLLVAVANGNTRFAKFFLDAGADVNLKNSAGETPLMHAIGSDINRMVEMLVERGANVNEVDANGRTILEIAEEGKNEQIIEIVMRKLDASIKEGQISNKRRLGF